MNGHHTVENKRNGRKPYVLGLPSWYPCSPFPTNGDFVQRHYQAFAKLQPYVVFYAVVHAYNDFSQAPYKNPIFPFEEILHDGFSSSHNFSNEQWDHDLVEKVGVIVQQKAGFMASAAAKLKKWRWYLREIKHLFKQRELPDLVHVEVLWPAGLLALYLKKRYGIPYIVSEHWSVYQPVHPQFKSHHLSWRKWIYHWIFKNASLVFPVGKVLGEQMQSLYPKALGNGDTPVVQLSNVVNTNLFHPVQHFKKERNFVFVHVSNMFALKQPIKIIAAFAEVLSGLQNTPQDDLPLLRMIGPAEEKFQENARQIMGKYSKQLVFHGEVDHQEVAKWLQKADALVLFSRYENQPCVVLEALCCGIPVIAPTVGELEQIITPKNGILFPVGDQEKLQAAMKTMLVEKEKFNKIEIAHEAFERYDQSVVAHKLKSALETILKVDA